MDGEYKRAKANQHHVLPPKRRKLEEFIRNPSLRSLINAGRSSENLTMEYRGEKQIGVKPSRGEKAQKEATGNHPNEGSYISIRRTPQHHKDRARRRGNLFW